jgi:hypothetical protein
VPKNELNHTKRWSELIGKPSIGKYYALLHPFPGPQTGVCPQGKTSNPNPSLVFFIEF